jgi:hypothetical protein
MLVQTVAGTTAFLLPAGNTAEALVIVLTTRLQHSWFHFGRINRA